MYELKFRRRTSVAPHEWILVDQSLVGQRDNAIIHFGGWAVLNAVFGEGNWSVKQTPKVSVGKTVKILPIPKSLQELPHWGHTGIRRSELP